MNENSSNIEVVFDYHERTKHQLDRYARGPGYMDWSNQPHPFRYYEGAPQIALAHGRNGEGPLYRDLFAGPLAPSKVDYQTISQLFYYSMALSAWKKVPGGDAWALRVNPSSGNLHPTESYLVIGEQASPIIAEGLYHYQPYQHALEARRVQDRGLGEVIAEQLPDQAFLIGLSSIYWRESWKYGERAYRYCNHDVGHALGSFTFAAACLGWKMQVVDSLNDIEISIVLGIDKQSGIEAEHVDCLIVVYPNTQQCSAVKTPLTINPAVIQALHECKLLGNINRLSNNQLEWPIIEKVALSTEKYSDDACNADQPAHKPIQPGHLPQCNETAFQIIHQRRSALAMDGVTNMARSVFYGILGRVQVEQNGMMFECLPWAANVSLFLFVHRVRDLQPGLYVLVRDPSHESLLRRSTNPDFLWERPDLEDYEYLRLYLLAPQELKEEAKVICCHQDIAADGVFSLGMLARFGDVIAEKGPWYYPRLYWETGLIGQILYLEAEAAGVSSTGIGCFFDDVMHQVLGIRDHAWQSLYHFTVGGALEDQRLQSYPCYHHLDSSVI